MEELKHFLDFARDAAFEAGRLTLGYYARSLDVIDKADGSPVTAADREAEALLRRKIEAAFPDHGIYGEEHGQKEPAPGCSYTWYIDPIDGTKSFIHGVPLYTNLLGLVREEESVLGIINLPVLGEQLSAASGCGAWLNGRRVHVSAKERLGDSLLVATDPRDLAGEAPRAGWRQLWDACRYPRTWGDAYGYYLVATGRAEIMMDEKVEPYDVAPMPVILREAGGFFTDWNGKETPFGGNGLATNDALRPLVNQTLGIE